MKRSEFGKFIRRARLEAGMGLREAARALKISSSYLCDLELNTSGYVPSPELLFKLSTLLDLPMPELEQRALTIREGAVFKMLTPQEASDIKAFYLAAKARGLSINSALKIARNAMEASK